MRRGYGGTTHTADTMRVAAEQANKAGNLSNYWREVVVGLTDEVEQLRGFMETVEEHLAGEIQALLEGKR